MLALRVRARDPLDGLRGVEPLPHELERLGPIGRFASAWVATAPTSACA